MKYMVAITEIVEYLVPVTAPDEESAGGIALDKIINTRDRDKWCVGVQARDIDGVMPNDAPAVSSSRKIKRGTLRHSADL